MKMCRITLILENIRLDLVSLDFAEGVKHIEYEGHTNFEIVLT